MALHDSPDSNPSRPSRVRAAVPSLAGSFTGKPGPEFNLKLLTVLHTGSLRALPGGAEYKLLKLSRTMM